MLYYSLSYAGSKELCSVKIRTMLLYLKYGFLLVKLRETKEILVRTSKSEPPLCVSIHFYLIDVFD